MGRKTSDQACWLVWKQAAATKQRSKDNKMYRSQDKYHSVKSSQNPGKSAELKQQHTDEPLSDFLLWPPISTSAKRFYPRLLLVFPERCASPWCPEQLEPWGHNMTVELQAHTETAYNATTAVNKARSWSLFIYLFYLCPSFTLNSEVNSKVSTYRSCCWIRG